MDTTNNENREVNGSENSKPEIKVESHTLMALLSYLGPLVIVPFLVSKDNAFVKFHTKQGVVLFIIEIIAWLLGGVFMWEIWFLLNLINLCVAILSIIGIVNVLQNKEKPLPLVGGFSKYLNF